MGEQKPQSLGPAQCLVIFLRHLRSSLQHPTTPLQVHLPAAHRQKVFVRTQ